MCSQRHCKPIATSLHLAQIWESAIQCREISFNEGSEQNSSVDGISVDVEDDGSGPRQALSSKMEYSTSVGSSWATDITDEYQFSPSSTGPGIGWRRDEVLVV
jgi:hypothetical protein